LSTCRLSHLLAQIESLKATANQATREIVRLTSGYPAADLWDEGIAAAEDIAATATTNAEALKCKAHVYRHEGV
jgi:hypothetical protein